MNWLGWEKFRHKYGAGDNCGVAHVTCNLIHMCRYPWHQWLVSKSVYGDFSILESPDGVIIYLYPSNTATWFTLKWLK